MPEPTKEEGAVDQKAAFKGGEIVSRARAEVAEAQVERLEGELERIAADAEEYGAPAWVSRIARAALSRVPAAGEDQRLTPAQARLLLSKIELSSGIDPPETFAALLALRALAGSVGEPDG